jgi:hypothetical protein
MFYILSNVVVSMLHGPMISFHIFKVEVQYEKIESREDK